MNDSISGAVQSEPKVTQKVAQDHGIDAQEYEKIHSILGRTPTYTELGIFSVMWSEHCSYKNSIAELKKLPRSGPRLLVKAGEENAGLVDIGGGYAIAFKIESHNHPSAIEPYQGAATGVGGIMRDIFTMGARPIAALNSLRFGSLENSRTKYLLKGVVKGIGDYGNSFGVPTVAGDIFFDDCYNENPLVNAMAVGIVRHDRVAKAIAKGEGNLVMIVGSSTGRDGIHGATFASEEISEESDAKRPSVQVGDPFTEKLLLEATLEAIQSGSVVGIQDMGAAGISCSTSEMSAKGSAGMVIDLDKVPVREEEMTPYEIMLSESQERMLLVVEPKNEEKILSIFKKWDLQCRTIGTVTGDGIIRINMNQRPFAAIPAECLVLGGGAPVYHRESKEPDYIIKLHNQNVTTVNEPIDYNIILEKLLQSENVCSRKWVTTQYDSMVRTNTVQAAIADAAVIRLKEIDKAIAVKTDCNPRFVYLNPYVGAQIAVAESARNVVCVGAKPLAVTNCLNFGNPYKPEIFWQFKEAIRGIADACKALETPVTGGNVSFYNENPAGSIFPTPVIGMLGEINSVDHIMSPAFKRVGDIIYLLGKIAGHLGGSEYVKCIHGIVSGDAPNIDMNFEKRLQSLTLELIQSKLINSAHDISDGGLAITLAESSIAGPEGSRLGARISVPMKIRADRFLFGEDQSCIVVSLAERNAKVVESLCNKHDIPLQHLGYVVADRFQINEIIDLRVEDMAKAYYESLEASLYSPH
jgi:phosphoribosylformylglycinamidine synthase